MLGSDKVLCACFFLVTQDGPTLLCLETSGEWGSVCVCVGNREPADSLQHNSRELPSALSSLSIPYSKCPRLEHDP